jgi:hypothetical protein
METEARGGGEEESASLAVARARRAVVARRVSLRGDR